VDDLDGRRWGRWNGLFEGKGGGKKVVLEEYGTGEARIWGGGAKAMGMRI
jgi:hypothetical protein